MMCSRWDSAYVSLRSRVCVILELLAIVEPIESGRLLGAAQVVVQRLDGILEAVLNSSTDGVGAKVAPYNGWAGQR